MMTLTIPHVTGHVDLSTKVTGQDRRGRTTEIPTSDPDVFLSVFTFHHKRPGASVFRTSVMGVRKMPRRPGDVFSSTLSAPMSALTVQTRDAGTRFSAERLETAHAVALGTVCGMVNTGDTAALLAVLAETPDQR